MICKLRHVVFLPIAPPNKLKPEDTCYQLLPKNNMFTNTAILKLSS